MNQDNPAVYSTASGAVAVVLYVAGVVVVGERLDIGASGSALAAHLEQERTRIQVGSALFVATAPFFVWFLATVASLARTGGSACQRAGAVALGCGLVFTTLFIADVTSLVAGALRPEDVASAPEVAVALQNFEFMAMATAAPAASAVLVALAVVALGGTEIWPPWLGWFLAGAGAAYTLRLGTLFTTDGAFAADGVLGLWVPVVSFASAIALASVILSLRLHTTRRIDHHEKRAG